MPPNPSHPVTAQYPSRRCSATSRRTGDQCRLPPIRGGTVCIVHGGRAPQVAAAAKRRLAAAEASLAVEVLGLRRDIAPSLALLEEVQWTAGHVAWLRVRLQAAEATEVADSPWLALYQQEREHLVAAASAAVRAGVEERQVRVAEMLGDRIVAVIDGVLADLGLSGEQAARVPEVVAARLRAVQG